MMPEREAWLAEAAAERMQLIDELMLNPSGFAWCRKYTKWADGVVRFLLEAAGQPPFAVIATGGYGRRELAPYSDLDITIVPAESADPLEDDLVRAFFRDLYQTFSGVMKLEIGYAYRLVGDCPGLDSKTRTGLLDMRLLAGPPDLAEELRRELDRTLAPGEFILAKMDERKEADRKFHSTPLVVEPHLKEGAGGLRNRHARNWIRHAAGLGSIAEDDAYESLLELRNVLQATAERRQDLLSRPRQDRLAELYQKTPDAIMARFYEASCQIRQEYESLSDDLAGAQFPLSDGVSSYHGELRIRPGTDSGEVSVGISTATSLGLRIPREAPNVAVTTKGASVAYALATGEKTIRALDRSGILDVVLPELTATRSLLPSDAVHQYTVFEHTMQVIRHIDGLTPGTFLYDVKDSIQDRQVLYLATIFHDIGKIDRSREHSEVGAEMARHICESWNLEASLIDQVVWLVKEHLTMARFIRIRDIQNPQTISDFADIVQDPNRLAMLTVLTYADISSVTPGMWTPAQATFQKQLYQQTIGLLEAGQVDAPDPAQYRRALLKRLSKNAENEEAVQAFVSELPVYYITSTPHDTVRLHMHFVEQAQRGTPTVDFEHRNDLSATEVTVCALDSPGLLSRLLAIFYAYDLSLIGIRACTTAASPPVALDTFTLMFSGRPIPNATAAELTKAVHETLADVQNARILLQKKGKDPDRMQRIFKYTYHEGVPGILEVRAPRGRGMPFRLSKLLAENGWNVVAARVGQWAGNAAGAFYVQKFDGTAISLREIDFALRGR